jgi:MFS family permease
MSRRPPRNPVGANRYGQLGFLTDEVRVRSWARANVGGLPRTYWYLWTGLLINKVGGFGVLFLSLYLVDARGLDATAAGFVVGLNGLGGAAGVLAGGVLADRWGRRRTLLASHAAAATLMFTLAFVSWVPAIAAISCLLGSAQMMAGPALVAAIVDVVPERDRTRAFNLQFWAFNLGAAAASLLAGLLAESGFTLLFVADGAATLVTFLVFVLRVPETLPRQGAPAVTQRGLHTVLTDRTFLLFVGLTLLLAVLSAQTATILPLAMKQDHLPPSAFGGLMAFAGALIVAGQLFVPRLIGTRNKPGVLAAANTLLAVGYGLLAFADILPVYVVAATIWTVGSMLAAPPNAATIAALSPTELRGRYQGVFYLTFPVAGFIAPALGGAGLQRLGDGVWLIGGALGLVAAAGHLLTGPARERRAAALNPVPRETRALCVRGAAPE